MAEKITVFDLEDGKVDIDTLEDIVNLQEPTTETRLSGPVRTWFGVQQDLQTQADIVINEVENNANAVMAGLGYLPPVPYASGLNVDSGRFTVSYNGNVYAPILDEVPFTTSGTFESDKFRLIEGVKTSDLASGSGSSMVGFTQPFAGAVLRTQADKNAESVSVKDFGAVGDGVTDDTTAIQAAIDYCMIKGVTLIWPDGEYNAVGALSNLHKVKHSGTGVIKRGSDLFYITPLATQTNILYVAPSGLEASDALSPDNPVRNVKHAFDIIKNHPQVSLGGAWRVQMLDGTFIEGVRMDDFPVVNQRIHIIGSRDPVTDELTTIMDGELSSRFEALNFYFGTPMLVIDSIHFKNWRQGSGTMGGGCGIQTRYTGYLEVADCIFENCDSGVFVNNSRLTLYGSVFRDSDYGFRSSYQSNVSSYRSRRDNSRPLFQNISGTAFTLSRGSQGHVDYCDFVDCRVGVGIGETGRGHVMGCDFKRSTWAAVRCTGSSQWLDDPVTTNNFNMGGADANAAIALHEGGSRETRVHGSSNGEVAYRQLSSPDIITVTGTTSQTVLVFTGEAGTTSFITRFPSYYFSRRKSVKISLAGTLSGPGQKTIALHCGGLMVDSITTSLTGMYSLDFELTAVAMSQQRSTIKLFIDGEMPLIKNKTTNVAINAQPEVAFNTRVTLSDSAGSFNCRTYEGWVIG